jgi:iron complex outermembrane recepter protein
MRNSMNTSPTIRRQLLSTVSALALLGLAYSAHAAGSDTDRPLLWIELGGQMENVSGQGQVFAPAFLAKNSTSSVLGPVTPLQAQRLPKFSFGEDGKISFQPEDSDWVFSASVRIGRSGNSRHVDHQTTGTYHKYYRSGVASSAPPHTKADYADTHVRHRESHAILDFSAGKDIGLGVLGKDSSSTFNFGVRFAQFTSKADFNIRARPDLGFKYTTIPFNGHQFTFHLVHSHDYYATGRASRSFRGVGPSLSWTGSAPFIGDREGGEVTFDWGVNASLLFGKQKAHAQHQETGQYQPPGKYLAPVYQNHPPAHDSNRSVTVPNVGGFAGASWRVQDFKVSLGYRADFFFGAIDGGIDARKSEALAFKGPFASINVGVGD